MTPPRLHRVIEKKSTKDKIMSFLNTRVHIIATRLDILAFVFLMILFLLICFMVKQSTYGYLGS